MVRTYIYIYIHISEERREQRRRARRGEREERREERGVERRREEERGEERRREGGRREDDGELYLLLNSPCRGQKLLCNNREKCTAATCCPGREGNLHRTWRLELKIEEPWAPKGGP